MNGLMGKKVEPIANVDRRNGTVRFVTIVIGLFDYTFLVNVCIPDVYLPRIKL